jgi:hypothetical protein
MKSISIFKRAAVVPNTSPSTDRGFLVWNHSIIKKSNTSAE